MKHIRKFPESKGVTIPNLSQSLRTVIDNSIKGIPTDVQLRVYSQSNPNDGEDEDDFETGTEVYDDLSDISHLIEKQEREDQQKAAEQQRMAEEAAKAEFDKRVSEEVAKRLASGSPSGSST